MTYILRLGAESGLALNFLINFLINFLRYSRSHEAEDGVQEGNSWLGAKPTPFNSVSSASWRQLYLALCWFL
jgi:hypothetical protein